MPEGFGQPFLEALKLKAIHVSCSRGFGLLMLTMKAATPSKVLLSIWHLEAPPPQSMYSLENAELGASEPLRLEG